MRPRPLNAVRRTLRLCAAVGVFAAPSFGATAADWPGEAPLRGSFEPPALGGGGIRWDGINFGGQLGLSTINTNFGSSTSQGVAYILRNSTLENEAQPSTWTALPNSITNGRQFGGFVGYSMQWDGVIVGFDVGYNRMSHSSASASDSLSRSVTTSDGYTHDVTIDAQSTSELVDYATVRIRGGVPMGQFMPYGFLGGAVGRFNYSSISTVTSRETPPAPGTPFTFGPQTQTTAKNNAIVGGFIGGLGVDVALTPNVFLRGEWEFLTFGTVNGIRTTMNTGRVGVGIRF